MVTAILRFVIFLKPADSGKTPLGTVKLLIYTIIEVGVYLIASCLPTYRSFYLLAREAKSKCGNTNPRGFLHILKLFRGDDAISTKRGSNIELQFNAGGLANVSVTSPRLDDLASYSSLEADFA